MGLWKVEEAAEYLGIRPKTLYEWVRLDRVPYRKIGFNVRFDPGELERWTEDQSRGAGTDKTTTSAGGAKKTARGRRKGASDGSTGHSGVDCDRLAQLAFDASAVLRDLERDVGASLSFPQRRKLIELADRLDSAASEVDGP